jgi:hypothetical protein
MAWHHISPDVTVNGFHKCCISSAVVGIDDDMVWDGNEESWEY